MKYIGTSSTQSAKRSKPKPSSNTTAGMPVRSGSVSVQTLPRSVRYPFGLPSAKGELANSAVASGCRASETRSFSTMSASSPKSRFTCTVQVRSIMSRPIAAHARHVAAHDLVAALGHPGHLLARGQRVEAQRREAEAERFGHLAHLAQMVGGLGRGLVQGRERRARKLELPARLEADRGLAALQPDRDCRGRRIGSQPWMRRPFEHGADAHGLVGRRGEVRTAEAELLVLGADSPRVARLASRRQTSPQADAPN